jgi:autotransporter-associated beta strand protein
MFNIPAIRVLSFLLRKIPQDVNFVPDATHLIHDRFHNAMKWWNFAFLLAGALSLTTACFTGSAATYYVGSIAALTSRIGSALPGDEIVVSNGVYVTSASIGISRAGTAANRILIRAEAVGGVEITGTHGFSFNSGAAYVTVQGFNFTHAAAISMGSSANHCRLTRNIVELTIPTGSDVSYINISGDDMEIDRNELRNKSTLGEMLDVAGSGSQVARRLWVHQNYFHDFVSPGGNGAETIRLGLSGLSLSTGNAVVEYNLFVRCNGENEMISNKSSGNTYRYNTVLDCPGGEISQRHGNDCFYYGNYMRNTAGMRVYGDRHRIFSNYLESNSIGVNMGNGDGDVYNGDPLTSHDRPDDNVVVFNTFINNSTHYQMGGRTGGLGSSNTVVANNIFQGGGTMASISSSAPYTGAWSNNFRWQTSSAGNMPASGYITINPLLAQDANGIYHLQSGSPAINSGVGSSDYYGVFSSYPYVSSDMDGQPRDAKKDIGADEFSAAPILAHILTTNDVGPNSFEGTFGLAASPSSRNVPPGVATNVSYTINVTDLTGSNDLVTLTVSGLPPGVTAGFVPSAVTASGSASLTLTISNTAPSGNFTLTILGASTHTTNFTTATLLIVRPPANLRWSSTSDGVWDIATTANWVNMSNNAPDLFFQGDSVLFADTPNAVTNVSLDVTVTPSAVTNDSSMANFTINGTGKISGVATIVKQGTSTLTLSTPNDFTGPVVVKAGVLRTALAGALGSASGATILTNSGTLDVNGLNFTAEPVIASGPGAGGQGAIVNTGPAQTSALRNVTLAGDVTFGGGSRWDIRAASSSSTNGCSLVAGGQPFKITKVGTNQVSLVAVSVDSGLGDIDVKEGVFAIQTVTSQVGNPNRTITVFPGATLELWNLNTAPLNKRLVLSNAATVWNENGNSIIIGPVTLASGSSTFNIGGTSLTMSNNILSGLGGFTKVGAGTFNLRGVNTYTGATVVNGGTLALINSASIANSSLITIVAGTTLDVTARSDAKLTLASGQILTGDGALNGSLLVSPGATVSPGQSIGTLNVTGDVTLQGTTLIELNKSINANDILATASSVTFGGTLTLTNLAGTLADGDSFPLFSASSYSGSFSNLVPAIPALNLAWDTSTLALDGTLRIVSAPTPQPRIVSCTPNDSSLLITGNNGVPGWTYFVLAQTNLASPLSAWSPITTNHFDVSGNFSFTNAIDPNLPARFYLLQLQ